jgi:hypothetical protein
MYRGKKRYVKMHFLYAKILFFYAKNILVYVSGCLIGSYVYDNNSMLLIGVFSFLGDIFIVPLQSRKT